MAVFACLGSAKAHADAGDADPGDNAWGLPGVARVGFPTPGPERLTLSARAGYGYTEELADEGGAHHRMLGSVGVGLRALPWLSMALRLDGRYDRHPPDELGDDDGWIGTPRLAVRAGFDATDDIAVGGEVAVRVPGRNAPSLAFGALALDTSLLASVRLAEGLHVGARVGFRFDRSAESVDQPGRLRNGDRIALGVSDFHAFVAAAGMSYRIASAEVLAELSADILLGGDAPPFSENPMRATVGVRYHTSPTLQLQFLVDVVPSGRPEIASDAPLVPVEPRATMTLGARYAFDLGPEPPDKDLLSKEDRDEEEPDEEEEAPSGLSGEVVDAQGNPLQGATVELVADGEVVDRTRTDARGRYRFDRTPSGPTRLRIEAEGYEPKELQVGADSQPPSRVRLAEAIPTGELRGLIRSYAGEGLTDAKILIMPGNVEAETNEEGRFSVELEEGDYDVRIRAPGYREQTRQLAVEENGVTILNAELRKKD